MTGAEHDPGDGSGLGPDAEPADSWAELAEPDEEPVEDASPPPGTHTALPPRLEAWRKRSAAGAILTGFALGLQEALEKRKEEPAIIMETSGEPPRELPVEAEFEYGRPRQSVVQIRPWLLGGRAAADTPGQGGEPGEPAEPDEDLGAGGAPGS